MAKLSVELNRYFFEEERQPKVKLADLLSLAGERGFGIVFVLLALPSALPVPAPGYSTPFGFVIFILAIQFILGLKSPWLPTKIMNASVKLETAQRVVKSGIPWLQRLEGITKPRLTYMCSSLPGRILIGLGIALMSISMMLIIPGTNTLPAMGIFLIGLGLVEDDGVISLAGTLLCLLIAVLMVSVIIAVMKGGTSLIDSLKEWLKSL